MISLGRTKNCIPVGRPFRTPYVLVSGRCHLTCITLTSSGGVPVTQVPSGCLCVVC